MNVLQVCPLDYGEIGGVSMHVKNISERLAQRGHNVTVYATNPNMKHPRYEIINGVNVERFKSYSPSDAYFFSWELLLRLCKVKFDIVHGHFYHAFPLHLSTLAKCKKFIATPHFHGVGHTPLRNSLVKLLKPFGKRTLERAYRIISVSVYEKAILVSQFGLDSTKVVVIPNGVDFTSFSGLHRRKRNFKCILYIGCLRMYKGVHYLVEVLPKLDNDVVLEIVGVGPLRLFLENRAKSLHVFNRVKFYENLERRELLQKYIDADVFILLSAHEAYSMVIAEALTAGTPCIVANASALSEWIDQETCFGINFPININELAKLIKNVIGKGRNKQYKKWIGTKILDWDDVVHQVENLFLD